MKISHFSKLANTSVRMLRHYEDLGLITVSRSSENNNYREYSAEQLPRVNQIKSLQEMGFSLRMIKEILDNPKTKTLETYFELQKDYLNEQLEKVSYQQSLLETVSDMITTNNDYLNYNVVLKELPERQIMSLRRTVSDYQEEQGLWQELYEEYLAQNVSFSEPPLGLTLYHNEAYEEENIDLEIQSSVIGVYQDTATVTFKQVPKITVASTTFQGSFEQMPLIMEALGRWIEVNQLEIAGPMINIYHVTAAQDPNPDNWLTEACLVVKTKEEI
ncbi:MerR family transcriptional regulator [Vagococcus hydrophili]|uniref:MerR family transcriptional regulator n=1 Tax=Vagococcus hydrophili TaxID=2714947 RepID=A0A6G8ASK8_9ENTE|nr:MerR family transcriptional regulator [Vagococcus hydrophili]QIL47922.1 MerR family transcriptional regulator [Vagococcus hydrophili]